MPRDPSVDSAILKAVANDVAWNGSNTYENSGYIADTVGSENMNGA